MCSVNDDGVELAEKRRPMPVGSICMKCKKEPAQLSIRVNDPFCKACFLAYCTHKFRSAFGKSKVIRDGEKVLIAFSGGEASSAMLHLVQEGKSSRAQKKLRFIPGILFIDESAALNVPVSDQEETVEKVKEMMRKSGYPSHFAALEEVLEATSDHLGDSSLSDQLACKVKVTASEGDKLDRLLSATQSLTSREDLIKRLRLKLIAEIAAREGYSKVILGTTGTRLAVSILADIATGRGEQIAHDTGILDDRLVVPFVRPLREFTTKEVSLYNHHSGVSSVFVPTLSTKTDVGSSIDRLTQDFLCELQQGFQSTTSTVLRTANKLDFPECCEDECDSVPHCILCSSVIADEPERLSAVSSLRFSTTLTLPSEAIGGDEGGTPDPERDDRVALMDLCCYGCQLTISEMTSLVDIPPYLLAEARSHWATKEAVKEGTTPTSL